MLAAHDELSGTGPQGRAQPSPTARVSKTWMKWRKGVAPGSGDVQVMSIAQDRFYKTNLDDALKAQGIKTLILTGWKVSGSVTYTAVGAMVRW